MTGPQITPQHIIKAASYGFAQSLINNGVPTEKVAAAVARYNAPDGPLMRKAARVQAIDTMLSNRLAALYGYRG